MVARCEDCGLNRTHPEPNEQKIGDGYYIDKNDCLCRTNNLKVWYKFADDLLDIVEIYKKGNRLLDVGTNIGVLVSVVASKACLKQLSKHTNGSETRLIR